MPHPHPRRLHHHLSLTFTSPATLTPQLYEWVSTGFPLPAHVHHYHIATRHLTPSASASASSASGATGNGEERGAWEDLESYESEEEGNKEGSAARRFARRGVDARNAVLREVDPWTTWSPPTPPQEESGHMDATTLAVVFGLDTVTRLDLTLRDPRRASWLDDISELRVGVPGAEVVEDVRREGEGSAEGGEMDPGERDEESGSEGTSSCWACRVLLRRCVRRRSLSMSGN